MSETNLRCGTVAIIGRPNVGKSTLLNSIVGEKVAIVSPVPQTTRNQIRGIYNDKRGQIIFIDTPGFHLGRDKLDECMKHASINAFSDVDCVIYLVDTSRRIGAEEKVVAEQLSQVRVPLILGLNKVDLKKGKGDIDAYIKFWEEVKGVPIPDMKNFTMIALSGQKDINIKKLLDIIFDYIPQGVPLYPEDIISDTPQKLLIADIIREKLFLLMREEVPHSIGVVIESMETRKKITHIRALIVVERETQKEIVIGKRGDVLKTIGTAARKELEEILEGKVFLELLVKLEKNWRDDISLLQEFGYSQ